MTQMGRVRVRSMVCVLASVTLMVTLLCGSAFGASTDNRRKIVMFYDSSYPLELGAGITVLHNLWLINSLAVKLPPPPLVGPDLALASLQALPNVQGVYDDVVSLVDPICPTTAPPPGKESYPWGQAKIDVPYAHRQHPEVLQTPGVTVAVMDTGIYPHLEFSQRIALGYNALAGQDPDNYQDHHGHGTHMAGIIAAALDGVGIIGAAPKAILVPVKVLDQDGTGYTSDVINGLRWIQENHIPLVNMSFGFSTPSTPLRQAIQSLIQSGIIMVASVGNRCAAAPTQDDGGGDDCKGGPAAVCDPARTVVMYPAAYPGVIGVAATNLDDDITEYSLEGNEVDVAAPGGEQTSGLQPGGRILSTNKGGGYGLGYGTSQAAAHVTGAVALALQLDPELSIAEVTNLLKTTAVHLPNYRKEEQGAGRINAKEMLNELP